MSAQPFNVGLVIDRLRPTTTARSWGGAADYVSITRLQDFPAPCGYVVLARERALQTKSGHSAPGRQSQMAQVVAVTFGVVVAVRNYRQLEGSDLRDELLDQLGQVRSVLMGWTPPVDGGRACQLMQGELTDYDASVALWTDVWQTQHIIRPESKT